MKRFPSPTEMPMFTTAFWTLLHRYFDFADLLYIHRNRYCYFEWFITLQTFEKET